MDKSTNLIPAPNYEVIASSGAETMLAQIRPHWQAKNLIDRVKMNKTGHTFRSHAQHGELLRNFAEIGGLQYCPDDMKPGILEWLILLYIGEHGEEVFKIEPLK